MPLRQSAALCALIEGTMAELALEETGQRLRQVHSKLHGKELDQLRQRLRRRVSR